MIEPNDVSLEFFSSPFLKQSKYLVDSFSYDEYLVLENEIQSYLDSSKSLDSYRYYEGSLFKHLLLLNNETILQKQKRPIRDMFLDIRNNTKYAKTWNKKMENKIKQHVNFFLSESENLDYKALRSQRGIDSLRFKDKYFNKPNADGGFD